MSLPARSSGKWVLPRPAAETSGAALVAALQRAVTARRGDLVVHARNVKVALDKLIEVAAGASVKGDQEERLVLVNDVPLPARAQARAIEALLAHFAATGLSEVRVTRSLTDAEALKLVGILRRQEGAEPVAACRKVLEGLWDTGLRGTVDIISLEQLGHAFARTVKVDAPQRSRLVYGCLLAILADYLANEKSDELQRYFGWRLMKASNALVSLAFDREKDVLALAATRGADVYIVNHAANTAALSVLVGKKLGLPRSLLVELAFAALFHASGKLRTPPGVVNKPASQRTPEEQKEFARHPYKGVGAILEQRRLDDPVILSALIAFQYDARRGVPVTRRPIEEIHPLSQIVALCQGYDAVATSLGRAPFEALAAATQDPSRPFAPVLVHVLGALVGALPVSPRAPS